jgi:hypothetical protein
VAGRAGSRARLRELLIQEFQGGGAGVGEMCMHACVFLVLLQSCCRDGSWGRDDGCLVVAGCNLQLGT